MTTGIVALAALLQLVAIWRALRVVELTSRHTTSILLTTVLAALAGRSAFVLVRVALGRGQAPEATLELSVFAVSLLAVAALGVLEPLLRSMKALNAAVSDSERRLEGVIGALAEGVIVRDGQGVIRTCNASAERLLGCSHEQLVGASVLDAGDTPALREEARAALIALHTGDSSTEVVAQARRDDGTLTWLSIHTRPLLRPGHEHPDGVVSSFSDVSESKHTERVLRDVTEGASSRTGEAFFAFLVERLAHDLSVAGAFVAEIPPERPASARTRALWIDGALVAPLEFALADSPCDMQALFPVVRERDVRATFPCDPLVAALGVESYCGVPLFDATGVALGLLAVIDRKPIAEPRRVQAVVQIFAVRAAAELAHDHAERRLETQRAFLRQVVDTSPNGVMARDRQGRVMLINEAGATWYGMSVEDATGLPFAAVEPDSDTVERLLREDLEVLESRQELVKAEERAVAPDGTTHWLQSVKRPIAGSEGRADQVLIVATDITERKEAEEALRRAEELYRGIVESAAEGIFRLTPEGCLATANPAFARMLGYPSVGELLRAGDEPGLIERHFEPMAVEHVQRCLREDCEPRRFVHRLRRLDGGTLWVSHHSRRVCDARGALESYHGTLDDITQRVLADEAQSELRDKLSRAAYEWQTTFDAIEAPVLVVDLDGSVQRLNRAAQHLAGRDFDATLGRPLTELGACEPWRTAGEMVRRAAAERTSFSVQVREPTTDATWDIAASVAAERAPGDARVILVARDITSVIALQESLRRSETMSAMGSLVAGVAHQVRNPLFGISSTIDAFEARFGRDETFTRYVGVLRNELERLTSLMQDLLEYGRPASQERQPVAVAEVMAQALGACQSLARRARVKVASEVDGNCGVALVDRRRMMQVFENLVQNALQHSRPGDKVTVRGRRVDERDRGFFECVVLDDGPGIPSEDLPRLFEPFFTRRRGGTGLGLSIAQRIVDEHGGSLAASNRPEGGAQMLVRLPLVPE